MSEFDELCIEYFKKYPDAYWPDSRGSSALDYNQLEELMREFIDFNRPFGPEDLIHPPIADELPEGDYL